MVDVTGPGSGGDEMAGSADGMLMFEPLSVIGERVRLRPLDPSDYGQLFWIEQDPTLPMGLRRFTDSIPPEQFGDAIWADTTCQFAIVSTADATLVGTVALSGVDLRLGFGRVRIVVRPDLLDAGWPMEALGMFLDHVFVTYPLRKLYLEVAESVYGLFSGGADQVFFVEGQLVQHLWCDGGWQDLIMMAFHREHWLGLPTELRGGLGALLGGESPA